MIVFALAIVALLGSTMPAAADPASLVIAGINALAGTTFVSSSAVIAAGSTTILTVGQAINAALFAAITYVASRYSSGVDPSQAKETFSTSQSSELRAIGRVRVGGIKLFGNTSSVNRFRLIAGLRGPIDGVETTYLGGREVVVEDDGAVSSPPYAKSGGSWVYIWWKRGDGSETAWSELTSAFPTLWTSAHRVRGIFQTLIKYVSPGMQNKMFLRLYSGGVPDVEHVVRAENVYDPRDLAQSVDDPSTWKWTDNGVLCATHVWRSFPEVTSDLIDWDRTALEADRADVLVATKTGTEKRARAWGMWSSEEARGETLLKVLDSIGGEIVETDDGLLAVVLIDDVRPSELTISARHLIDFEIEAGPESVERPNIVVVRYYSPERNYDIAEIDMTGISWARIESEIAATGERPTSLDFPFCPSASQAQRLARRKFAAMRADRGQATTNMVGLAAWGRRVVTFETNSPEMAFLTAIEPPRIDDDTATVQIPFMVWPELTAWNPATMEAAAPEQIPEIPIDTALDQPDAPSAIEPIHYPDGSKAVRIAYNIDSGLTAEATIRTWTGSLPDSWAGMDETTDTIGGPTLEWAELAGKDVVGLKTDARVRVFNADGDGSNWSDLETVTSPAYSTVAPSAPTIEWDPSSHKISVTIPLEIRIAYVVTAGPGNPGTVAAHPGDVIEWDPTLSPDTNTFTARCWTSDGGAGSATASLDVVG